LLTKNALVRTSEFPLERKQRWSTLVLLLFCRSALYPIVTRLTRQDDVITLLLVTAQRLDLALGPAPRCCIGPRTCKGRSCLYPQNLSTVYALVLILFFSLQEQIRQALC